MTVLEPRLFPVVQHELTSDDYYTPAWVFDTMGIRFDLDVCAPPGGIPWIPADRYFDMADDGLAQPWTGRVWMNPPYSHARPWVERFIDHANGACLVPASPGRWFGQLWEAADGLSAMELGGLAFVQNTAGAFYPHPLGPVPIRLFFAAFGEECVEAISRLGRVRR